MAERNCKCSGDNEGRGLKPDAALIGAIVRAYSLFFLYSFPICSADRKLYLKMRSFFLCQLGKRGPLSMQMSSVALFSPDGWGTPKSFPFLGHCPRERSLPNLLSFQNGSAENGVSLPPFLGKEPSLLLLFPRCCHHPSRLLSTLVSAQWKVLWGAKRDPPPMASSPPFFPCQTPFSPLFIYPSFRDGVPRKETVLCASPPLSAAPLPLSLSPLGDGPGDVTFAACLGWGERFREAAEDRGRARMGRAMCASSHGGDKTAAKRGPPPWAWYGFHQVCIAETLLMSS